MRPAAPAFEDEHFAFYGRILGGQQEQQPRWKRIVGAASADIGEAVAQLFVRVTFPPEAKARVEELVDHLLAAMGRAIRANDWMTETTRAEALAKLDGFSYKIGYPAEWRDYSSLELDRSSYLGNRLTASAFEMRRQTGPAGQADGQGRVGDDPAHVVNAYYHPLRNEIVFPAGILQPPFFYADADRRGELRRDRDGHRPRDHARLRRHRVASSTPPARCATGGRRRTARSSSARAK